MIPASVDAAWEHQSPKLAGATAAGMLVFARPFSAGSQEEVTLQNMVKACGFAGGAAQIIQLDENESMPWAMARAAVQPQYVLLLGVPPAQLGISAQLPANAATEFSGSTFIWTATLQSLTTSEAARKSLWKDVLQPVFKKG